MSGCSTKKGSGRSHNFNCAYCTRLCTGGILSVVGLFTLEFDKQVNKDIENCVGRHERMDKNVGP